MGIDGSWLRPNARSPLTCDQLRERIAQLEVEAHLLIPHVAGTPLAERRKEYLEWWLRYDETYRWLIGSTAHRGVCPPDRCVRHQLMRTCEKLDKGVRIGLDIERLRFKPAERRAFIEGHACTCQYCGRSSSDPVHDPDGSPSEVDHKTSVVVAGYAMNPDNLALACRRCNRHKGMRPAHVFEGLLQASRPRPKTGRPPSALPERVRQLLEADQPHDPAESPPS